MSESEIEKIFKIVHEEKLKFLKDNPDFIPDADFRDSHSCKMFANEIGECQWCGDIIYGSYLYQELYGGE